MYSTFTASTNTYCFASAKIDQLNSCMSMLLQSTLALSVTAMVQSLQTELAETSSPSPRLFRLRNNKNAFNSRHSNFYQVFKLFSFVKFRLVPDCWLLIVDSDQWWTHGVGLADLGKGTSRRGWFVFFVFCFLFFVFCFFGTLLINVPQII